MKDKKDRINSRKYLTSKITSIVGNRTSQEVVLRYKIDQILFRDLAFVSELSLILIYESLITKE